MSKVLVLRRLATLALVNIDLNTNFLTLIYLDCFYLLFYPLTVSVFIYGLHLNQSIVRYTCVVAKCPGFASDIEHKFFQKSMTNLCKWMFNFCSQGLLWISLPVSICSNIKDYVPVDL